jgi:uncharacterized C2H2 Zn-finger protein
MKPERWRVKGGAMTQTLYAHMRKKEKKRNNNKAKVYLPGKEKIKKLKKKRNQFS